ncbi:MAG: RNA polymerase sigma-70 factor [Prolixibacteraceae bacterium]
MPVNDDRTNVEYLKKDDFIAFDALFHKYSESIYSFVLSITRERYAAEEITQLVFLKVWEKRSQINEQLLFKSFLFSVTYNETISWLRKEKSNERKISDFIQGNEFTTNETVNLIEFRNLELMANHYISELPEKRREIFLLSRDQGFTNKEIANKLDLSVKTVENQMTSALKYLRGKLGTHDIFGLLYFLILINH